MCHPPLLSSSAGFPKGFAWLETSWGLVLSAHPTLPAKIGHLKACRQGQGFSEKSPASDSTKLLCFAAGTTKASCGSFMANYSPEEKQTSAAFI